MPGQYQDARNETAGSYEQQRRAFAEQANAAGLSSGANAQAALSMGNAYQGNLTDINRGEADTLADLELQRTQLTTAYNNAITKAKAAGNFELAEKLYQEGVRMDEAILNQAMAQAELDWKKWSAEYQANQDAIDNQYRENVFQHQVSQDQIANDQWEEQFNYGKEQDAIDNDYRDELFQYQQQLQQQQTAYEQLLQQYEQQKAQEEMMLEMAQLAASYGDYSYLKQLGIDTSFYEQQQAQQAIENALKSAAAKVSSGGSGSGGGGGPGAGEEVEVKTPDLGDEQAEEPAVTNPNGDGSVFVVGIGRVTWQELEAMVNRGEVIETYNENTGTYSYKLNRSYNK